MVILVGGRIGFSKSVSLLAVSGIMFTAGAWLFNRRDIFTGQLTLSIYLPGIFFAHLPPTDEWIYTPPPFSSSILTKME